MKPSHYLLAALLLAAVSSAQAADGLIAVTSPRSSRDTMNRLEELVQQRGKERHLNGVLPGSPAAPGNPTWAACRPRAPLAAGGASNPTGIR
jgi:hypothetical protein